MKKTLALIAVGVLATPIVSQAQQADGEIIRSVEAKLLATELRSDDSGSRRSAGRTWAGVAMITTGAALISGIKRTESCRGDVCTRKTEWLKSTGYPGIGLAVTGVLFTTVWSGVPANPHIDIAVTPDGMQISKTFGF